MMYELPGFLLKRGTMRIAVRILRFAWIALLRRSRVDLYKWRTQSRNLVAKLRPKSPHD